MMSCSRFIWITNSSDHSDHRSLKLCSKLDYLNESRLQIRTVIRRNNAIIRKLKKDIDQNKDGEIVPKL